MPRAEYVLWLAEDGADDRTRVGGKASALAALLRAGFPVPDGFCLTTAAYRCFVQSANLESALAAVANADDTSSRRTLAGALRDRMCSADLDDELSDAIRASLDRLGTTGAIAVRSSAVAEDQEAASFAGQGETFLNLRGWDSVVDHVKAGWASFWSERAVSYRRRHGLPIDGDVALLLQVMVPSAIAGVAFTVDPLHGRDVVVVEAAPGLGDALTLGEVTPERYELAKSSLTERDVATGERLLRPDQLRRIGELALQLETDVGRPMDIEWGLTSTDGLYLFQARPVTTAVFADVFDEPGDGVSWTSGFLDERFPEPVSPLGWSVIRQAVEEYAFREPLRIIGHPAPDGLVITRLRRGHPYANVAIFQSFYKLFPDWLLPEDVQRYFPHGDVSLRRQAKYPGSVFDHRMWRAALAAFLREPAPWSPWHNYRLWAQFSRDYARVIGEVQELTRLLGDDAAIGDALSLIRRLDAANADLLRIHRWSMTHADVLHSLLRRLSWQWFGPDRAPAICAGLVSNLSDRSLEMNEALSALADRIRAFPDLSASARTATSLAEFRRAAVASGAESLVGDLEAFLSRHGHRSYSLDLLCPSFAADPTQVLRLLAALATSPNDAARVPRNRAAAEEARRMLSTRAIDRLLPLRRLLFTELLRLTQEYVRLREDQRFFWQSGIAALRALYCRIGERLDRDGLLDRAGDVFFLTRDEVVLLGSEPRPDRPGNPKGGKGGRELIAARARSRRNRFVRLRDEFQRTPRESYPPFLEGDRPIEVQRSAANVQRLTGQPVSPGLAMGRVRVVLIPESIPELQGGDILVTRGADPGWTPLFGRIGALVMESGGQLSHGSVVAREYGVPAVVGVPNVTQLLRDGDLVVVDGAAGTVTKVT